MPLKESSNAHRGCLDQYSKKTAILFYIFITLYINDYFNSFV